MTASSKANVLVVGGGIGGLATAAFLRQSGHRVTVLEQAIALRPVGAGIVLHINTMRVLDMLGLAKDLEARGALIRTTRVLDEKGGSLAEVDLSEEIARGKKTIAVHRSDLHELLARSVDPASIRLGVSFSSLTTDDTGVDVRLSDGSTERYDLVVGADGIHSKTREALFGPIALRYSGYTCWRLVGRQPASAPLDQAVEQVGRGHRVGLVPIGAGRMYAYFTANADAGDPHMASAKLDDLRKRFASFGGAVPELLASVQPGDPIRHDDLFDLELDPWFHKRILLLGDAAHAMTPNLGQGAAMAIEDAKALQVVLDTHADISQALVAYEKLRRARVTQIHKASWDAGRVNQWSSGPAVTFRSLLYKVLPVESSSKKLRALIDGADAVHDLVGHRPDLPPMTETSRKLVRFLVKMGQIDGYFDDQERAFIQASLHELGEHVGASEIEQLASEVSNLEIADVITPFKSSSQQEREHIVQLGYLAALSNGHVALRERKALDEVRKHLDVSKETFDRIAADTLGTSLTSYVSPLRIRPSSRMHVTGSRPHRRRDAVVFCPKSTP
ncbi:MAG: FAD-dependent monooxygenase [Polyangiaceae bacterium]